MKRREFLANTAALVTVFPLAATAGALDTGTLYKPGMVRQLLADGETVFIDFSADWCSTCQAQARVIQELKAENPVYEEAVKFVAVDWDEYGTGDLSRSLKIPRRSTLVVLKGDQELGRIVAGTSRGDIKALMDLAVQASQG